MSKPTETLYYTCVEDFGLTYETDPGEAVYYHLERLDETPETVTLYAWRATDVEIEEGVSELELVSKTPVNVAGWKRDNDYE